MEISLDSSFLSTTSFQFWSLFDILWTCYLSWIVVRFFELICFKINGFPKPDIFNFLKIPQFRNFSLRDFSFFKRAFLFIITTLVCSGFKWTEFVSSHWIWEYLFCFNLSQHLLFLNARRFAQWVWWKRWWRSWCNRSQKHLSPLNKLSLFLVKRVPFTLFLTFVSPSMPWLSAWSLFLLSRNGWLRLYWNLIKSQIINGEFSQINQLFNLSVLSQRLIHSKHLMPLLFFLALSLQKWQSLWKFFNKCHKMKNLLLPNRVPLWLAVVGQVKDQRLEKHRYDLSVKII